MIQELLYTSAPRGLKPGSRGFCSVLSTQGMSAPIAVALEGLSGYRPLFAATDPRHASNPVVHSHVAFSVGGRRVNVLSRIADYGLDYTQRSNKLAHHVIVDPENQSPAGPAWLLARSELMRSTWDGEPRIVPLRQSAPMGDVAPAVCTQWKKVTGDAGWAGVLAEAYLKDPQRMAFLICPVGLDPLPLIAEAIALLPKERRWDVTFSTYFTSAPQNVTCAWRCLIDGTPEVHQSRRYVQALRLNLIEPLAPATGGPLIELARTGRMPMSAVQRTTSRDAASAALDDLPPPTSGSGYRLQPARAADEPPLLDVTVGVRKRRGRSSMLAGVIAGAVLLAAIGIGVALWQRIGTSEPKGTPAVADADAQVSPNAPAEQDLSPLVADAGTDTETPDVLPESREIASKGIADDAVAPPVDETRAESNTSTAASNSTTGKATASSPVPQAIPESTSGSAATPDSQPKQLPPASQNQSPPELQPLGVGLSSDENDAPQQLTVVLPPVSPDELRLRLFVPVSYASNCEAGFVSETRTLALKYRPPRYQEDLDLANLYFAPDSPSARTQLVYEWKIHANHRNVLKWCVLQLYAHEGGEPISYRLHPVDDSVHSPSGWTTKHSLLSIATTLQPDHVSPSMLFEPVHVNVGELTAVLHPDRMTDTAAPLDTFFRAQSVSSLQIGIRRLKLASLKSEDLPLVSTHFESASGPTLRFAFHEPDYSRLWHELEKECDEVFLQAKLDFGVPEVPDSARPIPSKFRVSVGAIQVARDNWKKAVDDARAKIEMRKDKASIDDAIRLESLNSAVVDCLDDTETLLKFTSGLSKGSIQSARIYYVVTDISNGGDRQADLEVDLFRIAPTITPQSATPDNPPQAKK